MSTNPLKGIVLSNTHTHIHTQKKKIVFIYLAKPALLSSQKEIFLKNVHAVMFS